MENVLNKKHKLDTAARESDIEKQSLYHVDTDEDCASIGSKMKMLSKEGGDMGTASVDASRMNEDNENNYDVDIDKGNSGSGENETSEDKNAADEDKDVTDEE